MNNIKGAPFGAPFRMTVMNIADHALAGLSAFFFLPVGLLRT